METNMADFEECSSIAIMGGTFDPIHYGHLLTAQTVCTELNIDKVIFMPAGHPAHKDNQNVTAYEHRYAMTVLATKTNRDFCVSRLEIDRKGQSYTIDTISELKEIFGSKVKLYFIMGADAVHEIETWRSYEKLLTLCDFVAVTRPGYQKSELVKEIEDIRRRFESKIHYLDVPAIDISSSGIRERVKDGKPIKYFLPESVEEYIMETGIYK